MHRLEPRRAADHLAGVAAFPLDQDVDVLADAGAVERHLLFDDEGLHITIDGKPQVLPVDNVVVCAGQEPNRVLADELIQAGIKAHVIGGADVAAELDAKRAIDQGTRLAAAL